jgi:aromatic ring-opening dioxygenase LigB subunit
MVQIAAGMASSHAYTFIDPHRWEERREVTRERYKRRYGEYPAIQPQIEGETLDTNLARYAHIRGGLDRLKQSFESLRPDTLILIADDQDENYREDNLPQIAIYTGERATAVDSETARTIEVQSDAALATAILNQAVDAGFDLASSNAFPDDRVRSHAHAQILNFLDPQIPVVLIFLNAIHVPAPSPTRCYQFGQCLRGILDALPDDRRAVLYASGGMSHFTAGYPWAHYEGPYGLGSISEGFDREAVAAMQAGTAGDLVQSLSSRDLLANGAIEFRQWITLLGALDGAKPEWVTYEPFYRAVMAMGVAYWPQN